MPRTPDRKAGQREEDSLLLVDAGLGLAATGGQTRYSGGRYSFYDARGEFNPRQPRSLGDWAFQVSTTMADPSAGNFRLNNADETLASAIALSSTDSLGTDFIDYLIKRRIGEFVVVARHDDPTKTALYRITAVTNNTTWVQFGVTYEDQSTNFTDAFPTGGAVAFTFHTALALVNHAATTDPVAGDDSGDGYEIGSRWINITADTEWVCLDAAVAAAVWKETTQSGGGGGVPIYLAAVRAATTGPGTLASSYENGDTIDGVTLATNDRILIKDGTDLGIGTYTYDDMAGTPNANGEAEPTGGTSAVLGTYTFDDTIGTPNANGEAEPNNNSFASVTSINFFDSNAAGTNVSATLLALKVGDRLKVTSVTYQVSGAPVDNTTYVTVPVSHVSGAGTFPITEAITISDSLAVTAINFFDNNAAGADQSSLLSSLLIEDLITIGAATYIVTALPVDNTTYWTVAVTIRIPRGLQPFPTTQSTTLTQYITNGVYTVNSSGAPTRATDMAAAALAASYHIPVGQGALAADTMWVCLNDSPDDVVGTDNLFFRQYVSDYARAFDSIYHPGGLLENDFRVFGGGIQFQFHKTQMRPAPGAGSFDSFVANIGAGNWVTVVDSTDTAVWDRYKVESSAFDTAPTFWDYFRWSLTATSRNTLTAPTFTDGRTYYFVVESAAGTAITNYQHVYAVPLGTTFGFTGQWTTYNATTGWTGPTMDQTIGTGNAMPTLPARMLGVSAGAPVGFLTGIQIAGYATDGTSGNIEYEVKIHNNVTGVDRQMTFTNPLFAWAANVWNVVTVPLVSGSGYAIDTNEVVVIGFHRLATTAPQNLRLTITMRIASGF